MWLDTVVVGTAYLPCPDTPVFKIMGWISGMLGTYGKFFEGSVSCPASSRFLILQKIILKLTSKQSFKIQPCQCYLVALVKGALDKYNIYLFIANSIEDFKLKQYRNFQLILPMHFHFMRCFVNSIIFRVSHRLLYCLFIDVDFKK